jgi:hypothetical protein
MNSIRAVDDTLPTKLPGGVELGFRMTRAENGWVLSDYDPETGVPRHYVCVDDDALVAQIKAWTDRTIETFRKFRTRQTYHEAVEWNLRFMDGDRG